MIVVEASNSNKRLDDHSMRQNANNKPIQSTDHNTRNRIRRLVEDFEYNTDYDGVKEDAVSSPKNYDNGPFYLARYFQL